MIKYINNRIYILFLLNIRSLPNSRSYIDRIKKNLMILPYISEIRKSRYIDSESNYESMKFLQKYLFIMKIHKSNN